MAYLARGNKDFLAGEVLIYVKCAPKNQDSFFYAMFVSSDDFRLDKFSTANFFDALEVTDEMCSVLPIKFMTENEIFASSARNILRPIKFIHENEDSSIDILRTEAITYIHAYYSQINSQYDIDFKDNSNFIECGKLFRKNLDFLVDKMLEGYEGRLDLHKAEAAASLIRRVCAEHGKYKSASLMTEWAADKSRPFGRIKRIVYALKDKVKRIEISPYEIDDEVG